MTALRPGSGSAARDAPDITTTTRTATPGTPATAGTATRAATPDPATPADTRGAGTAATADTRGAVASSNTAATADASALSDAAALEADLLDGFFADPPTMPPRWFYDEKGSLLFDQITRLAEYYPTRAEAEILRTRAADIVGAATTMVELGAGTCEKTRVLLDEFAPRGASDRGVGHSSSNGTSPRGGSSNGTAPRGGSTNGAVPRKGASPKGDRRFVPVDISTEMLHHAAGELVREYPGLRVDPVVGDLTALDGPLPGQPGGRLVLFLGGTIGNFTETQRADFIAMLRQIMGPGDRLLLGFDLVKSPDRLVEAYDDAAGVTAEFNLNMLDVIVRTVECTGLERCDFRHEAVWNAAESRIEMWLRAVREVQIEFPTLGRTRTLAAGEGIRTEIARKFQPSALLGELAGHGFREHAVWADAAGDFGLGLVVVD